MFGRKREPIEITPNAYARWLRAGRPPFDDFLALPEEMQEELAAIGDDHAHDLCVALATALANPQALMAGAQEAPSDAMDLAQHVASKLSMGGTGGARHVRPRSDRPVGTLFGAEGEQIL